MKKIILIAVIGLLAGFSYGQLGFGIKGAITMSKLSTDIKDYDEALKAGYQLGAFVRLGKKLHLQPEAYFTAKTGKLSFDYTQVDPNNPNGTITSSVEQQISLKTIDVPILIGFQVAKLPTLKIRVQAGPVASIVVNKKFNVSFNDVDQPDDSSPILKDDFSNVNWAAQFGAGIDFLFLTADIRYEMGLNNIYKAPENATEDPTMKNNLFFVSVGWKIL
jgi:hypothetical protein